ncbi:MAG TPA: N-acetylmuramoyl-L-alanine amidase-like domain-containing protein [Blastocatellia bacterium]|nr:N-acetylmuramoyl-L-alanine amidase-like domain-containing protein [Blastocatellia bacterium]
MITEPANRPNVSKGTNFREASELLQAIPQESSLSNRIDFLSAAFLGRPYLENSLIGGPETPEVFTVTLDGFDCVTYLETVLALAVSKTSGDFLTTIRQLRYENGEVGWKRRNHFMIDWARKNEELGFIQDLTTGPGSIRRSRTLGIIDGLPRRKVSFKCFPRSDLSQLYRRCETGDVILFVSTRKLLDVFHVGLMVRHAKGNGPLLRHATRKAGSVIEQDLAEFVDQNRMSGVILLRPTDLNRQASSGARR